MSGRRERIPREELDTGLRRYVPKRRPSGNGPTPSPNGAEPQEEPTHDAEIGIVERRPPMATPRRLGEILLMARQSRGVELERAARDTKIRARYLAALEAGDFRELPGTVYTKGFLRNYAQYLGLDPDVIVAHYRRELGGRGGERVSIVAKTLRAPRGGLTLTPGLFVGVILTLAVIGFAGYVGVQFVRFVQPPELTVTRPASVESTIDAGTTIIAGTATAGATVTITGPDGAADTTATGAGTWSAEVPLRKGRNEFLIVALDTQTSKRSPEARVIVMVPLPSAPQAPVLSLTSPADGTTFTNGAIPIVGSTSGTKVSVTATYLGPAAGAPEAGVASPPPAAARDMAVETEGTFSGSYELTTGQWRLSVTSTGDANRQTALTRTITVAYTGVNVLVELKGGRVWLRVRVDGELAKETPTTAGVVFEDGTKLTFTADELVEIRAGVPSRAFVTVNGVSYGALGDGSSPGAWAIGPSGPPEPA